MRTWLGELDYRDAETTLQLDWNKLMRGNVRDVKSQIGGEWSTNVRINITGTSKIKKFFYFINFLILSISSLMRLFLSSSLSF